MFNYTLIEYKINILYLIGVTMFYNTPSLFQSNIDGYTLRLG